MVLKVFKGMNYISFMTNLSEDELSVVLLCFSHTSFPGGQADLACTHKSASTRFKEKMQGHRTVQRPGTLVCKYTVE